jgi:hypothetical protein
MGQSHRRPGASQMVAAPEGLLWALHRLVLYRLSDNSCRMILSTTWKSRPRSRATSERVLPPDLGPAPYRVMIRSFRMASGFADSSLS